MVDFMETSLLSHGAKLKSTLPLEKERDKDKDYDGKDDMKGGFGEESLIPPESSSSASKIEDSSLFSTLQDPWSC